MPEYNKLSPQIARQLCHIVGERRFQYGDQVKPEYSHDEMPIYGKYLPEAVCLPETTEEVSEIIVKPEIVDPDDIETLQDILVAAVNEAIKKVKSTNEEELSKIAGGMNVPGMF